MGKYNNLITDKAYVIDAFTETPFYGNPAGVMILNKRMSEQTLQGIAAEINASETAFIIPEKDSFHIRYFTPTVEVPLCGHATLASAHLLYKLKKVSSNQKIRFESPSGTLIAENHKGTICLKFPAYQLKSITIPLQFEKCMGFKPLEVFTAREWTVAVAENEDIVQNLKPDYAKMETEELGEVIITAVSKQKDTDYVLRCFAPSAGIPEDPVTGSAQCALTPLWNNKTGKKTFHVKQLSRRGGILDTAIDGERINIMGKAVTIMECTFFL